MAYDIGDRLRAARTAKGVSLGDAAAATRIRSTYLEALETEQFDVIGGDVYAKGFLRTYATYLDLDADELLAAYREIRGQSEPPPVAPAAAADPLAADPSAGRRRASVAGTAVLLVVIALGAVSVLDGGQDATGAPGGGGAVPEPVGSSPTTADRAASETSPSPEPTTGESSGESRQPSSSPPPEATGEAETLARAEQARVEVAVEGAKSWVRVTVDGDLVSEGTRFDGFSEEFVGEEVSLRIGRPGPVSVWVMGQEIDPLGEPRRVVDVTCRAGEDECEVSVG